MKKTILISLAAFAVIIGFFCYKLNQKPSGSTIESRELILSASSDENWQIATETELDGYLLCGIYSRDCDGIAVFAPKGDDKYTLMSTFRKDKGSVIVTGTVIGDKWYDLFWYNGFALRAEITYKQSNGISTSIPFSAAEGEVLYHSSDLDEYTLDIVYYGQNGEVIE